MTRLRVLLGPVIAGLSIWCAAGVVTVASSDAASLRFAMPAPWWVLVAAIAAAACVPAWRRHPLTAIPAVLSTIPWWPVPLPPVALLWTGPMAWVPVACALAAAIGLTPIAAVARAMNAAAATRATVLAGVLTFVAGGLTAWSVAAYLPATDEPHYLMITQSLIKDHDLRIENNHTQRDYASFYNGELRPDFLARGKDGEIYSIHAPGLAVLVLPAFAVFGYLGAQLTVLWLAALTGALVWRVAWRATGDPNAAWFAWASIAGSAAFLFHSYAVFPDGPAALVLAVSALLFVRLRQAPAEVRLRSIVLASVLVAGLPWLHTRLAVVAGGLGVAFPVMLLADASLPMRARVRRAAVFALVPLASVIGWLAFFQAIYGTPSPAAPYGGGGGNHLSYIPGGVAGLLFDAQFGLVAYTPVFVGAFAGLFLLRDRLTRSAGFVLAAIGAAYLAAVATYWMWWAGSSANPARFAVAILPAAALPLAAAWTTGGRARRTVLTALLGISLAVSAIVAGVGRGALAWNGRDAEAAWLNWFGPLVNLPRAWPSFFWSLNPDVLSSEIPFVVHAAVWLLTFTIGWLVVRAIARSETWTDRGWRVAVACWLLGSTTVAAQAGWWLNNTNGLSPARSQEAALSRGGVAWRIAAGRLTRVSSWQQELIIRTEEPGRAGDSPPWLMLGAVPPGEYVVRVADSAPPAGHLLVVMGRSQTPVLDLNLAAGERSGGLKLPVGAVMLAGAPDKDASASGAPAPRVELIPVRVTDGAERAVSSMAYGAATVAFLDDHVYAEPDGFWVRSKSSARMIVRLADARAGALTIHLRNGAAANAVDVDAGAVHRVERLGPRQESDVVVPVPAGPDGVRLTIGSPAGFRPVDVQEGTDARDLGVRIMLKQ